MKKNLLILSLLGLLGLLLSACTVTIDGGGLPPGVDIYDAQFTTDWEAPVNGDLQNVICDDRTTNLTYSFRFSGDLDTWESFLRGVNSGDVEGRVTLDLEDSRVGFDPSTNTVTVNYEIRAGGAPLLTAPRPEAITPQAIVPEPVVEGYTQLFLRVNDFDEDYELFSRDIAVLANCG